MSDQFLEVIDRDEAQRRFGAALKRAPLGEELVPLAEALGRILARDVHSAVNVPAFDRSNFDGYAVRAADTFGAAEEAPRHLKLLAETVPTSHRAQGTVTPHTAMQIATGGMLPRGADAVVLVEHADLAGETVSVRRAVAPGHGVSFAGTDITQGECVLRRGVRLTSRETGVAAAIGVAELCVLRRVRVAVFSTGDEIIPPGAVQGPAQVYDSNSRIIADAVRELGCEALELGIVPDDAARLRAAIDTALQAADVVLLSGGTSKGAGDVCYRVVREYRDPGIVAHGVALKPGKPICLAVTQGKPLVVLPGFPTSAIFTFHEFVAPVLRLLAGTRTAPRGEALARLAVKIQSDVGRTEYVLVGLTHAALPTESVPWIAFPLGKGSGSVTAFSSADGFVTVPRHREYLPAGAEVRVTLLAEQLEPADLVVIGSHCLGLDALLSLLRDEGWTAKFLSVGSTAGLDALARGQCDVAPLHLLDPATGTYNTPFLTPEMQILGGYARMQGVAFRSGDPRFAARTAAEAIAAVTNDPQTHMINRNAGSGTRILLDSLLAGARPAGYAVQASNHHAVAAAVQQGRVDWGVCIATAARLPGLDFLPLVVERYELATTQSRRNRPAVLALEKLLASDAAQARLRALGLSP